MKNAEVSVAVSERAYFAARTHLYELVLKGKVGRGEERLEDAKQDIRMKLISSQLLEAFVCLRRTSIEQPIEMDDKYRLPEAVGRGTER
jgi:hypothetical protein